MNTEMMPIKCLAAQSLANLFAKWYGLWSMVGGITFIFKDVKRLNVPLGLFIPFVDWQLNFSVTRAPTVPGVIVQALFFILFCMATGWLSGVLVAAAYNLAHKHLGFQLRGSIETQSVQN